MLINKNKPYYQETHTEIIPANRQFFCLTVGERGSGKSATQELLLETLFEKGWTVFDAWSAGFEAMFYCVNLNCKKRRDAEILELKTQLKNAMDENDEQTVSVLTDELYKKQNELACTCHKRYPITVLCSDVIDVDQKSLDRINEIHYTKEEWDKKRLDSGNSLPEYDYNNPPEKPLSERPKEWIKIVKLPFPTKTNDSASNREIVRIFTEALLSCRKERRILAFVPKLFPDDFMRYKTLSVIVTALPDVTDEHFKPITENELGRPLTKYEKCHHRLCVLMRELAELAPQNMKTNEYANLTKRGVLSIIYTSRHSRISLLCDVQKVESVFKEIRTMCNSIIIKRSTESLLGDELKFLKKRIEEQQSRLFERFGSSDDVKDHVKSIYPPLNELNKNYCYVLYSDDWFEKWRIPSTNHHKKQEDDDFYKLTGFSYKINQELVDSHKHAKTPKTEQVSEDDKELYDFIKKLRNPKEGKEEGWKNIKTILIEQQDKGKFKNHNNFETMEHGSIRKWFKRNSKIFEKTD
ncbi:MAG: hypothetical protein FJ356_02025 [Thaumarchaeota archaeon]|nr:hypothetical protein [Nitrososphaerota archaeon]